MSQNTRFTVSIDGVQFNNFHPDSGSCVTVISKYHHKELKHSLKQSLPLHPINRHFRAANGSEIIFQGFFFANLATLSGTSIKTKIYVLNLAPEEPPLLGESDMLRLGLIKYNPNGGMVKKYLYLFKTKDPH